MKKKYRILFFKPLLNWLFVHYNVVTFILLTALTKLIFPLFKEDATTFLANRGLIQSSAEKYAFTTGVFIAIPVLGTLLLNILQKRSKTSVRIKRKLYNIGAVFYHGLRTPLIIKKTISKAVNLFYFHDRRIIQKQQGVVDDILTSMNTTDSSRRKVFWIQGSSYSGKTTTVFNLLIDLISKDEYIRLFQKLDGNIVYFDLGKPELNLEKMQQNYVLDRFSNCLVIIDNLHKLPGELCFKLLEQIILNNHAYAFIILMRYPQEFLTQNDRVDELEKIIVENGTEYKLNKLTSQSFGISLSKQFTEFCETFFDLEQIMKNNNNEIIIHLSMLYQKRDFDTDRLLPEIQIFLKGDNGSCAFSAEFIAIISCSLFTGSFNLKLLTSCLPAYSEARWYKFLEALMKIGFLTCYPNSIKDYNFHECIARSYLKNTIRKSNYYDIYIGVFRKIADEMDTKKNPALKFLYCMLCNDIDRAKELFDHVAVNANFLNLYKEMMFLFDANICEETFYYREIGILCDRCGRLKEAAHFYSLYLDAEKSADALYKLVQINHKIIDNYPAITLAAMQSSDLYLFSLSNYWKIHINMHRGIFEFEKIYRLAYDIQPKSEEIIRRHPYDGLHLIRRLYFDVFRLYYLEGIFDPEKLKPFCDYGSRLYHILQDSLQEFDAYYIKFAIGLMLGQDVLFSLAFENKGLNLEQYDFLFHEMLDLEPTQTCDKKAIAMETIRIYSKSIDLFEKMGDKTSIFVKYHMYNIKLILAVDEGNFSECESFCDEYRTFAFREEIPEYQAYAETFKLKMTLIQLCCPAIIGSYGTDQYDELKNIVRQKLGLIQEHEKAATSGAGNQYASIRLALYAALFYLYINEFSKEKFREEILRIKDTAQKNHYNRELKIISYIERYNFNLSPENIQVIFTFYPIVPQ